VNTRCVYHRLKSLPSDRDNLTLCPILDFANHTRASPHLLLEPSEIWNATPRSKPGDNLTLVSSHDIVIKEGEELCLKYGFHSNRTLFVEYGFVNEPFHSKCEGEVDVQDIVEQLFEGKGIIGSRLKGILTAEGYWGCVSLFLYRPTDQQPLSGRDWTLHSSPSPAHPSYRLVTALRLYEYDQSLSDESLQPWRDTLTGKRYTVSEQNEAAWRTTLLHICEVIIQRAESRLNDESPVSQCAQWVAWMHENVRSLWNEEKCVAEAVLQSLRNQEQF